MKRAAAPRRDRGLRAWIKITINRIKKNKYLAIIEGEWFILHFHSAGWKAAPEKSICNYRHPTQGRSSPSIHLPPPATHQHHHPQNKCQNNTQLRKKEQEIKDFSLLSTALCFNVFTICMCTVWVLEPFFIFPVFWGFCLYFFPLDLIQLYAKF